MSERVLSSRDHMTDQLIDWAYTHVGEDNPNMVVYGPEIKGLPGEDGWLVEGDPQPSAFVNQLARKARPQYDDMLQELEPQLETVELVNDLLLSGNSIMLAFSHGDLIDTAIGLAVIRQGLKKFRADENGIERDDDGLETAIIHSKMLTRIGYRFDKNDDPIPTVQVLQWLANKQFLSFPRSATGRRRLASFLDKIDSHNKHLRKDLTDTMDEKPTLVAFNPSGTTDKPPTPDDTKNIMLGRAGEGTVKIMLGRLVLPIVIDYIHGDKTTFKICGLPKLIKEPNEVHEMMESMAVNLNAAENGKNYFYERAK